MIIYTTLPVSVVPVQLVANHVIVVHYQRLYHRPMFQLMTSVFCLHIRVSVGQVLGKGFLHRNTDSLMSGIVDIIIIIHSTVSDGQLSPGYSAEKRSDWRSTQFKTGRCLLSRYPSSNPPLKTCFPLLYRLLWKRDGSTTVARVYSVPLLFLKRDARPPPA